MSEILLDREGDANLPDGYQPITSEVEFLVWADKDQPLMIRGKRVCEWAEIFYRARGINYRETRLVRNQIRAVCTELTDENIQILVEQFCKKISTLTEPLTIYSLLQALYPYMSWHAPLSLRHAANWLIWVYNENPSEHVKPLLKQIGELWQLGADHEACHVYKANTRQHAQQILEDWLGIGDRTAVHIVEEFPGDIPVAFQENARQVWSRKIIESHGVFFEQIERLKIPYILRKLAARETYRYYLKHPDELGQSRVNQLRDYLGQDELNELHQHVAPLEPGEIPEEPADVLTWFLDRYLPYREWEHNVNSLQGKEKILCSAQQFATWYLNRYPKALAGDPLCKWLNFNKVNDLNCNENNLILLVVLDGLHVTDAHFLLQSIFSHTKRLSTVANELVFTSLPTITQFAKEALFRGVPPVKVPDVDPIGEILPEDKSPAVRLANVFGKGIYLWRVLEPDRTYHQKNKSENLNHDVKGRLEAEASKIKEIVERIPDHIILNIIITTDHGRMLGKAVRTIAVPDGMQGHSRAAWGNSHKIFPESGYIIEDSLAYLFAQSFGLPEDVVIPLDERAFLASDDRGGSENYPHGGIFPEEIIVPWIVLARDSIRPDVEITISGIGYARRHGVLKIYVLNNSDIDVILKDLQISLHKAPERNIELGMIVKASSDTTYTVELDEWPTPLNLKDSNAIIKIGQPNQLIYDYQAQLEIQSEDIYVEKDNNILEDLI